MKRWMIHTLAAAMLLNLVACGTLIYPERMGHSHSSKIDYTVLALDAAGLLFFVVPGLIALAVDFSNGTVYLPSRYSQGEGNPTFEVVHTDGKIDKAYLEALVQEHYGIDVDLDASNTRIEAGHALSEIRLLTGNLAKL